MAPKAFQLVSDRTSFEDPRVARWAAEVVRKAAAMGLAEEVPDFGQLTFSMVTSVVERVGRAGVARDAVARLKVAELSDGETVAGCLREIDALLEDSPLPETEWGRLLEILGREDLTRLLGISSSSANRYERGERRTPDDVAARLHFLALAVGDLAGAYNNLGIRRWFQRRRSALEGRTPAELLEGRWDPEDPGPQRVSALARALIGSPAT